MNKITRIFFGNDPKQKVINQDEKQAEVRQSIMNVMAVAQDKGIDGLLMIYSSEGHIWVTQGGLEDDMEGISYISRGEYLINKYGIPRT